MNSKQREKIEESLKWSFWDEYEGHIANIHTLRNTVSPQTDKEKYNSYMDASSASRVFFTADPKELIEKYFQEIESVSSFLGNSSYSPKQIILNFMEYIRMSGMYENLSSSSVKNQVAYPGLSQSGLSIAILGKGVCKSQAEFLSHLLIASNMQGYNYQVQFYDKKTGDYIDSHEVVTAELLEGENYFLDPTFYNGSVDSLKGSFDMADLSEERRSTLSILEPTEKEIEGAREIAQSYLIRRFGIKEISEQLGLEDCGDLEKQMRILTFMERNLAPTNHELSIRSVVMGSHELEVGKLLELFYKANGIPYKIQFNEGKQNTVYTTMIDGVECSIFPKIAFSNTKSMLSAQLHYYRDVDGKLQYLWAASKEKIEDKKLVKINGVEYEASKEKFDEIRDLIQKGRKIADEVKIPQETIDIDEPIFEWGDSQGEERVQKTLEELQAEEKERFQLWCGEAKGIKVFKTGQSAEEHSRSTGMVQESEHGEDKKIGALIELYSDESIDVTGVNRKKEEIKRELGREEITQNQEK